MDQSSVKTPTIMVPMRDTTTFGWCRPMVQRSRLPRLWRPSNKTPTRILLTWQWQFEVMLLCYDECVIHERRVDNDHLTGHIKWWNPFMWLQHTWYRTNKNDGLVAYIQACYDENARAGGWKNLNNRCVLDMFCVILNNLLFLFWSKGVPAPYLIYLETLELSTLLTFLGY